MVEVKSIMGWNPLLESMAQSVHGMCAFLLHALKLSTPMQRSGDQDKTVVRADLLLCRLGIPQPVHDGFTFPHQQERGPQSMDNVLLLPVIEASSIRDGPIQSPHVVFSDDLQEAA